MNKVNQKWISDNPISDVAHRKIVNRTIKNRIKKSVILLFSYSVILLFSYSVIFSSCDYLDIVPDNVPTVDHAFLNRTEAQRYLYGLFGGMPNVGNADADPALLGCDEIFVAMDDMYGINAQLRRILRGEQGPVNPLANYWSSSQTDIALYGGKPLWTTIADCNVFLENIHKPYDLMEPERIKWTGEALFVKAYLHFWLFRQYGPIPLIRDNLPIATESDQIMRYREPVDEVADYIVSLLNEAITLLPLRVESETEEMGRPNKCIAAALKAQVLTLAASPLFNCNPDYAGYIDKRGVQLFPQDKSLIQTKWKRAADAVKEAIDLADEALYRLYDAGIDMQNNAALSKETILAMQVRGAVTERWNNELIWGNTRTGGSNALQRACCPKFDALHASGATGYNFWAPTLHLVEQFYTKNGLPIEDDKDWTEKNLWALRTATLADRQYIRLGNQTIELHFDREARFYASISFDQGTYFGNTVTTADNSDIPGNLLITEFKLGKHSGYKQPVASSMTGYLCKKLINCRVTARLASTSYGNYPYAFPIIRLADLYLLYAEALNEWKATPDDDVYEYIDLVRDRTGLKGVVETWRDHAVDGKKNLPESKEGMREIIRRERLNELAFEGARYWDLRRWKLAEDYLNRPIRGLNIFGETEADFYVETELFKPSFDKMDYFTPIRTEAIVTNTNLLQSPYWYN